MKTISARLALLFLGGLMSVAAHAQIFMCKDAAGKTYSSDRPIPECANRAMREIGKDGVLIREIAAPLTAEEKRRQRIEDDKRKADIAAKEDQRKADRALMERYRDEADIEKARQESLGIAQDQIRREELSMDEAEKQLKQAQADADAYKKKNIRAPADVGRRIEEGQREIGDSKKLIQDRQQYIIRTNHQFDEALKRYRELNGENPSRNS